VEIDVEFQNLSKLGKAYQAALNSGEENTITPNNVKASKEKPRSHSSPGEESDTREYEVEPGNGFLGISLDTQLALNWPSPSFVVLPVHLEIEVIDFRSTFSIEFHPRSMEEPACFTISILPGYSLDLNVSSLIGSRTKLRDVPRISELIHLSLKKQIQNLIVEPSFITLPLPEYPPKSTTAKAAENDSDKQAGPATKPREQFSKIPAVAVGLPVPHLNLPSFSRKGLPDSSDGDAVAFDSSLPLVYPPKSPVRHIHSTPSKPNLPSPLGKRNAATIQKRFNQSVSDKLSSNNTASHNRSSSQSGTWTPVESESNENFEILQNSPFARMSVRNSNNLSRTPSAIFTNISSAHEREKGGASFVPLRSTSTPLSASQQ
jgi:hypothetical protein